MLSTSDGSIGNYDLNGNPQSYLGNSLVWEKGRQLKQYGADTYKYNNEGIRIKKTTSSEIHNYILDGTNRYYNPEVGRFINADDILVSCAVSSVPNAFSYCLNNPICRSDHFGYAWRKTTNSSVNSFVDEIAQLIPNIYSDDILSRSSEIKILQLGCNTLSLTVSIGAAIQTNKNAIFGGMFKKGTLEVSAFLGINNYACFSFSAGINWKKAYIKIGFLVALSKKASGGYVGAYNELSIATWLLAVVTTAVAVVSIYSPAIAAYIAKLIAGIRSTARAMIPVLVPAIPKIVGALI